MGGSYLTQRAMSWWTKAQNVTVSTIPPHAFPIPLSIMQKSPSVSLSSLGGKCQGYSFPLLEQSIKHDFIVLKARIIDFSLLVHSNLFEVQLTVNQDQKKGRGSGCIHGRAFLLGHTAPRVPHNFGYLHFSLAILYVKKKRQRQRENLQIRQTAKNF